MTQILNVESLAVQFGTDLAAEIADNISYCKNGNLAFKLEIIDQNDVMTYIAFSTYAYSYVYQVSNKYKRIVNENYIGKLECMKLLEMMEYLDESKEKQRARDSLLTSSNN